MNLNSREIRRSNKSRFVIDVVMSVVVVRLLNLPFATLAASAVVLCLDV